MSLHFTEFKLSLLNASAILVAFTENETPDSFYNKMLEIIGEFINCEPGFLTENYQT